MTVENNKILIVAMLKTPDYNNSNVNDEITIIQRHVEFSAIVEILIVSTTAVVFQKITACSLIHFVCHDFSNTMQFSKSAFLLATKLTVNNFQLLNHQFV